MRKKILLIIESCNPELSSVPLVGYNFLKAIEQFADVHLVTHCRNREAIERNSKSNNVTYYEQSWLEINYYKLISYVSTFRGQVIWPIRHALQFPIYFFFDRFVFTKFSDRVKRGDFDIVHALTPIMPRYPYKIVKACKGVGRRTPFVLGPVNGGVPYPEAFQSIGRKEFSYLNWLRYLGSWLVPGYRYTYANADVVLAGSSYTKNWLKKTFPETASRIHLLYENGVSSKFYSVAQKKKSSINNNTTEDGLRLLFIGRLEPYKGCDMLIEALGAMRDTARSRVQLTVVGDGSQRSALQKYVEVNELSSNVRFTGWIPHHEVPLQYSNADLFCFPSVREFGGAVVMEAMAAGLPCLIVDNGGIGEYVTDDCGVKIQPLGRKYVIEQLCEKITEIMKDSHLFKKMVESSSDRAEEFSWENKSRAISNIYNDVLNEQYQESSPIENCG